MPRRDARRALERLSREACDRGIVELSLRFEFWQEIGLDTSLSGPYMSTCLVAIVEQGVMWTT